MKARVFFWYQGAFPHQRGKNNSVDLELDIDEGDVGNLSLVNSMADDALSDAITAGLIDSVCDAGISDFGVERVSFKAHRKKADFTD